MEVLRRSGLYRKIELSYFIFGGFLLDGFDGFRRYSERASTVCTVLRLVHNISRTFDDLIASKKRLSIVTSCIVYVLILVSSLYSLAFVNQMRNDTLGRKDIEGI